MYCIHYFSLQIIFGKFSKYTLCIIQISYCVTVATIEKVNSTKHGWYFLACHKCPKIARGEKPPYTCDDGHNTETEIVRYISYLIA